MIPRLWGIILGQVYKPVYETVILTKRIYFLLKPVENVVTINGILTPPRTQDFICVTGREICLYIKFIMEEK